MYYFNHNYYNYICILTVYKNTNLKPAFLYNAYYNLSCNFAVDLHFDPSTSEVKSKLLRVRERKELMSSLESLDLPTVCQEVESLVSKGMHLTIYPERKALWDTIKGSKALHNLISAAKAKFTQLYHSCGKGADKYSRFYFAWMQYMASYTSHKLSSDKATWINLTASCSSYISEDTSKVMICDILQSLQNYLTGQIAKELECKSINDDASEEACHDGDEYDGGDCSATSDDTALYRIGGWALLSAKRFRMNYITQNKGNVTELTEEICLLNELHLSKEAKMDAELPIGLTTLDRGGLTIPKKELLPYLRETETRILEFLNDLNYRRYGNRLFEV